MTDYYLPDDEPPEDISYEAFDDVIYTDDEEFTPIDLDALDDALPAEGGPFTPEATLSQATSDLLDTLDDALPVYRRPMVEPPRRVVSPVGSPVQNMKDDTERLLDTLDDALPAESGPAAPEAALDQATSDLLDTLDDALPPIRRPVATPSAREAVPAAPPVPPPQAPSPVRPPTATRPPIQPAPAVLTQRAQPPAVPAVESKSAAALAYQVLIGLPPELGALVLELRATGNIEDMPPPGLCLTPRFHTPDPDALDTALERWTQQHLPMALEITGVQAEVVGAQQYVAAWHVQPQERLRQALTALKKILGGLVRPLPGEPTAIRLRITIGERIAARRYPYVIAQMQRDFEPTFWHAQTLVLASSATPTEWDIVATYPGALPRPAL